MRTLPLQWDNAQDDHWDLVLSPSHNLDAIDSTELDSDSGAHIGEAKYCAQTVANSCKMFLNDAYFFQDRGIPYFEEVLAKKPPRSLVFAYWRKAAFLVPLVDAIDIRDYLMTDRVITGQIRITTRNGSVEDVSI